MAAVEFALIMPLLLSLYLGTVEVSTAVSVDKRVASVAGALGDLVARADGSLTESELTDYFSASSSIMAPYSHSILEQVVTCVAVDNNGNTKITWSRGYNGGIPHVTGDSYNLPTELTDLVHGKYVIVSEAQEDYKPLLGYVLPAQIRLYHEFYHLPRFGEEIKIT